MLKKTIKKTTKKQKLEKPLKLDMGFDEAMKRIVEQELRIETKQNKKFLNYCRR